jgi:hypothetical protein
LPEGLGWTVYFSNRAEKQRLGLPEPLRDAVIVALVEDLRQSGPTRGDWPNYSKLGGDIHHCHLNKRAWRSGESTSGNESSR